MFRVLKCGSGRIHFRRTLPTKVSLPHITAKRLRVSSTRNKLELLETFISHPLMVAVTGGGGVTLMAALYRNPQFLKLISEATRDRSILVLPQKPSHDYQSRNKELETLNRMVKQLKSSQKGVANVVYITGQPGHGKTQLASEFARAYYKKGRGLMFRKQFVGTLNASSQSSLIHSYITLAIELGCNNELSSLKDLTGIKGELQSLEMLSDIVRKELKRRPGWLLVIDNLTGLGQTDMHSSLEGGAGSIVTTPPQYEGGAGTIMPALPIQQSSLVTGFSSPNTLNVGVSYGLTPSTPSWNQYWPQPGSENWGSGVVVVTTHDRGTVQTSSPSVKELFLQSGMTESDAMSLLHKVSGCHDTAGSQQLVNLLDKVPLSVASAGFYIKSERTRNPNYGFVDYLKAWNHGLQEEGEKMLVQQNRSYPVTMRMAVTMATKQLAFNNSSLEMVFTLLGLCAHSPVPMSVIARVLGVRPDINSAVLESIRHCVLLQVSMGTHDERDSVRGIVDVEKVSIYSGTREILKELFLGFGQKGYDQNLFTKVHHVIDCLIDEYESARGMETVQSYRQQHLIIPHLEMIANGHSLIPGFKLDPQREARLVHSLGDAYLLKGKPQHARTVLERGLKIFEEIDEGRSLQAARLATRLGLTYRQLGMLKESKFILNEALKVLEMERGKFCIEVAEVLSLLSTTFKSLGRYQQSRKCLERALVIFESVYGTKHTTVATVLTNLGSTWRKLGNSAKSKELFEKALKIQQELLEPLHPMIASTLGNLSVAYTDLGNPSMSVELLNQALLINKHIHGPDHISVAITQSQLSNAYRHLGDMDKSKVCAKDALSLITSIHGPLYPGLAIANGILGSTYLEMGEVSKACDLLESSVTINRTVYGQIHSDTATVETQLGNALRLSGKLRQSKELLESTLEIKQELLETNHPSLAVTLNALGKVNHELGYYSESLFSMQKGKDILRNLYSDDHPQILFIEADLARVLRDTNDLQLSADFMNNAISKYNESTNGYTKRHPKYASMLAIYGLILRDMNELTASQQFLTDALDLQKQILSTHNLMKVETLCNLGTVQHRLQRKNKALDSLNGALDMMNVLGNNVGRFHPLRSTVLIALGRLLLDMERKREGEAFFKEGVDIRIESCGEFHPNVAAYYEFQGKLDLKLTDSSRLRDAIQVYASLVKRESALSAEHDIALPVLKKWEKKITHLKSLV